jgi:hypothetical protein
MSSLLSVTAFCSCGLDGTIGAVFDSTCSGGEGGDDAGGGDVGDDDVGGGDVGDDTVGGGDVDEVKIVESAFNGPDFRKPLLF